MNSYISLILAAERAKDMHDDAVRARYGREARLARRAARDPRGHVTDVSRAPESYEDFLCQTAQSAMREPTAARRSQGQPVG
jgi:hypothetical protein